MTSRTEELLAGRLGDETVRNSGSPRGRETIPRGAVTALDSSRTGTPLRGPDVEEVDGVPCDDWGAVQPTTRNSTASHAEPLRVTTIDPRVDGDVLTQLGLQCARTVWALPLDIAEREPVDNAKASEP